MPIGVDGMEDPAPDLFDATRAARGTGAPMVGLLEDSPVVIVAVRDVRVEESKVRDELEVMPLDGGFRRPVVINGCLSAFWGFRRRSGSQCKHLAMKSTKCSSSHRKTCASVLLPGRRRRPRELTTGRGAPVRSDGLGR